MAVTIPLSAARVRARLLSWTLRLRDLWPVVWACRVSIVGVIAPGLLLMQSTQARDLFGYYAAPLVAGRDIADHAAATLAYWLAFTALVLFFWCLPVHQSARLLLSYPDWLFARDRNPSQAALRRLTLLHRHGIVWLPRLLGSVIFVILVFACRRARADLPSVPLADDQAVPASEVIGNWLWLLQAGFSASAVLVFLYFSRLRRRRLRLRHGLADRLARSAPLLLRYREAIGDPDTIRKDVAASRVGLAMIAAVFVFVVAAPQIATKGLVLALVLPVIAGAWVPILTRLTFWSQRSRLPLVPAFLLAMAGLTYWFGDRHDISRADEAPQARPTMTEAIERWKAVNCNADGCPRPILVSSAGGASRAAFFTLTVLGDLMDNPLVQRPTAAPDPVERAASARGVVDRLFAVSGVSGGAVGAAIFSAAVANSADGLQPCRSMSSRFWFRDGPPTNWRGCMQAIVAEDFLSKTIIGLTFRDSLSFFGWSDRATVLEQDWIDSVARWIRPDGGRPFLGLDRAFTRFGPNAAPPGSWQPMLVLNGTSVSTGRRILTTQLDTIDTPRSEQGASPAAARRIFMDSYDLFELLSGDAACSDGICAEKPFAGRDVRMATGASNSARFPIISPPGTLKRGQGSSAAVVDRIVDGGYFENDGITTTIDLARALSAAGLHPAVLHIANNPLPYPRTTGGQGAEAGPNRRGWQVDGPSIPTAEDRSWLLALRGPVGALFATRDARATYALRDLENDLDGEDAFAEVLVYGEPAGTEALPKMQTCSDFVPPVPGQPLKDVSMSWWMSQPVQQYLDMQLTLGRNCASLNQVKGWLAPKAPRWHVP